MVRHDRRVGAGPADAVLLQRLDQRGLGVARRRLGEVLLRQQRQQVEQLARASAPAASRQSSKSASSPASSLVAVALILAVLVAAFVVDAEEAGEAHARAAGAEEVVRVVQRARQRGGRAAAQRCEGARSAARRCPPRSCRRARASIWLATKRFQIRS